MPIQTVAVLGASKDRSKFGNKAVRAYRDRGFEVFPVNPRESEIEGIKVYPSIKDLPKRPNLISVYLPPPILLKLLPDIAQVGCDELWLNPGTESSEVLAAAEGLGLQVIQACSLVANRWHDPH